jgi:hypothetical protein
VSVIDCGVLAVPHCALAAGDIIIWAVGAGKLRLLLTTGAATLHGNGVLSASVVMSYYLRLTAWGANNTEMIDSTMRLHRALTGEPDTAAVRERVQEADEERVVTGFTALLKNSIWARQRSNFEHQQREVTAMCVALLCDRGFIDARGVPVGLCTLVSRLSYIEPGNFFIARLFMSGRWSQLASGWQTVRTRIVTLVRLCARA